MILHDLTLMLLLSLCAAIGSIVLFSITLMKVNSAGSKLWGTGFALLSISFAALVFLSDFSYENRTFIFLLSLLSGHALILAGTWHYVGVLIPTTRMALLIIPIVITTFVFTFVWPNREVKMLLIGCWIVVVRLLFVNILCCRSFDSIHEKKVSLLIGSVAFIEVILYVLFTYMSWSGQVALVGEDNSIPTVGWVGSLLGITVGAPLLLLLSTTKFITELDKAAHTDILTGLANRRGFYEALAPIMSLQKRQKVDWGVLMIDVDWFKKVNDKFGHLVGDQVLETLGKLLQRELRESDLAARWGGEEFCVLVYDIKDWEVENLANRIRQMFSEQSSKIEALKGTKISASIGVALSCQDCSDFDVLQRLADEALYDAKRIRGKDCVKFGTPHP